MVQSQNGYLGDKWENSTLGGERTCRVCELRVRDSVEHVVLKCNRYEEERAYLRESTYGKYNQNKGRGDGQETKCV